MTTTEQIAKLEAAGYTCKEWSGRNETRLYVEQSGRKLGYLVEGDNGTTGTCSHITTRQGSVAEALRS